VVALHARQWGSPFGLRAALPRGTAGPKPGSQGRRADEDSILVLDNGGILRSPSARWGLGRSCYAQALEYSGRIEEALAEYRVARTLDSDIPWLAALEAGCLARHGNPAEADRIWEQLECSRATQYVDAYYMAPLLDALGRRDEAFSELERARDENSSALYMIDVDPKMDPLRPDARFQPRRNVVFAGR
jgi:tetratricopeptide (TPR) repeat protein